MSVAVDSDAEDDAVSEIAEAAGVSPAPAKPSMSAPRRMLLFGLVVVVALAVLLCCWGFRVQRARHAQDQRGHFLQAARQCALNLTTIDWRNAEADVRRILDGATGEFYNDFAQRSQPFVEVLRHAKASTVGTITEAGLQTQTADTAQALVAVSVQTSNAGEADPVPRAWRMRIRAAGRRPGQGVRRRVRAVSWSRVIAYGLLPGLALALTCGAGLLKWQDGAVRDAAVARAESVRAATDGTTALLSYRPDTVQHDLESARSRLTGTFLDAYTQLTHDVVIPGAQQKQISAVATVAAAASVSTSADRAVVLLFVNQTITVGKDAPTTAASSVRVTLDNINGRWLISQFEPI